MIASYDFGFCHVEVYDDYILSRMKEGVTVSPEFIAEMSFMAEKHFKNKFFVYITHRVNSYSVNPISYFEGNKITNMIGFAVVSKDPKQRSQSRIEKTFFDKELRQFENMEEALEWKDQIIQKHNNGLTST